MHVTVKYVEPIQTIRRHQMRALLDDLHALEAQGLDDHHCSLIKAALASVASAAADIPDGSFWSGTILGEAEKVADAYSAWNGVEGRDKKSAQLRRSALKKIRRKRQSLARRVHINQHVLKNDLDTKLVTDMYAAFRGVSAAAPLLFKSLAKEMEGRPA